MGNACIILVFIIGLSSYPIVRATETVYNAQTALEDATKLLKGWHKFRNVKGNSTKEPIKPGGKCTESINETLAILLFDRLEVSQTYYPYKDFKTRSHVAHHVDFYKNNMPVPESKAIGDFCRSRIPQDFHRYEVDGDTGFSIPYTPFHFVCSGLSGKCTHCMEVNKTESDLFTACHDHNLRKPEPVFKEAYDLHFKIKKWFRKARTVPLKVYNHHDSCSSSLEQNLQMVKLWKLMVKKTGADPTDKVEYEKEWKIVEELDPPRNQSDFKWAKDTFNALTKQWKNVKWCKPRGGPGKYALGLVCWHKKCERCRDQEKFTTADPIVTEICNIQANEEHEDDDIDVESKSTKLRSSTIILLVVGMSLNSI